MESSKLPGSKSALECAAWFAAGGAVAVVLPRLWHRMRHRSVALSRETLPTSPQHLLESWWIDAQARGVTSPRALVLATSDQEGGATARYIIPHCIDTKGNFIFGTNVHSQKIAQLRNDNRCELVWSDLKLNRQVRIRGMATAPGSSAPASRAVFDLLPESCRLGLNLLDQGKPYSDTEHQEALNRFEHLSTNPNQKAGTPELPTYYTAIIFQPESYEFYLGGHPGYVNDRFLYLVDSDSTEQPLKFKPPIRLQG